jgi:hypothetical protein
MGMGRAQWLLESPFHARFWKKIEISCLSHAVNKGDKGRTGKKYS